MEGGGTAKTPANRWQGVPRYLWEGKTMEGTTPSQNTRRFRHPRTIRRCCSRPLLRRGRRVLGIRGRTVWVLEAPVDDTSPLDEPLRGRGRGRVTFPRPTRPPDEVKEASIMQAKQPRHKKRVGRILCREDTKAIIIDSRSYIKSAYDSKNYKFVREG